MSLDMNPEIRAQWCAALRSGDYQQAKEALRAGDGQNGCAYCCLGVLTELYARNGQPLEIEVDGWGCTVWDYDGVLAPPVRDWAGLSESNPPLTGTCTASELNDGGATFAEIADLIDGGAGGVFHPAMTA